jgi:hypothetical protein
VPSVGIGRALTGKGQLKYRRQTQIRGGPEGAIRAAATSPAEIPTSPLRGEVNRLCVNIIGTSSSDDRARWPRPDWQRADKFDSMDDICHVAGMPLDFGDRLARHRREANDLKVGVAPALATSAIWKTT